MYLDSLSIGVVFRLILGSVVGKRLYLLR